jgi:hypothetical protein
VRDLAVLFLHLVATVARVAGPGGARSVVAESVLVKHQLLILNRSRKRSPNLRPADRVLCENPAGARFSGSLFTTSTENPLPVSLPSTHGGDAPLWNRSAPESSFRPWIRCRRRSPSFSFSSQAGSIDSSRPSLTTFGGEPDPPRGVRFPTGSPHRRPATPPRRERQRPRPTAPRRRRRHRHPRYDPALVSSAGRQKVRRLGDAPPWSPEHPAGSRGAGRAPGEREPDLGLL